MLALVVAIVAGIVLYNFHERLKKVEAILRSNERVRQDISHQTSSASIPQEPMREGAGSVEDFQASEQDRQQGAQEARETISKEQMPSGTDAEGVYRDSAQNDPGNWLVRIGVILLGISVVWFVSYAFAHDWIGPVGRVVLGMAFGLTLLGFGTWRYGKHSAQGVAFMVGGAVSIYVSTFAGLSIYEFFGPIPALLLMSLVVVYLALYSAMKASKELALTGLIFGFISPLMVFSSVSLNILFGYLFLLSLGTIWLDRMLGWRMLTFIAFFGVYGYSLLLSGDIAISLPHFSFALLFLILFFGSNIASIVASRSIALADYAITILTGIAFYTWTHWVIPEELRGAAFTVGALLYAAVSYGVYTTRRVPWPMYLYGAAAFGLLIAATGEFFSGSVFAVLLGLEIGGLVAASAILFGRGEKCGYASSLAWLLLWPVALTFFNIVSLVFGVTIGGNSLFGGMAESIMGDLLVLLIFAALFWVLSVVFLRFIRQEERVRKLGALFFMSVATGYSVLFVWFLLHAVILDYYFASMVALVLYAVVASFLYVAGTVERRKWMKGFGIAMIVLVLARLFLVEYWAMEDVVTKIITFFVVGSMLIAASLLAGKFRTKRSDDGASINDASL